MKGLNKRFQLHTLAFINRVIIQPSDMTRYNHAAHLARRGVAQFDLEQTSRIQAKLALFEPHKKTHHLGRQHPISAYWLHYDGIRTYSVQLGAEAKFMFTPVLDGCFIGIGAGQNPRVVHVPGDDWYSYHGRSVAEVNRIARATVGNLASSFNSNIDLDGSAHCYTFLGKKVGVEWKFYIQGHTYSIAPPEREALQPIGGQTEAAGIRECVVELRNGEHL